MNSEIQKYNENLDTDEREICILLANIINGSLKKAESKIWHGSPVWFIEGNPIVGYWKRKNYIQLLFWSGQSFEDDILIPEGKFKAAELRFNHIKEIKISKLKILLKKSKEIQWDYKNIIKRKGVLLRLK